MASSINASITSTGIVQTADASGILQLQTDGTTGLTLNANANLTVSNTLFVSGSSVQPLVLGTAQNTTSGTYIDFTGIPNWVKRITVMFNGVSLSGTALLVIQLGTTSGVENSGYLGSGAAIGSSSAGGSVYTAGFRLSDVSAATTAVGGLVTICNLSGNIWVAAGILSDGTTTKTEFTSGYKTLAAQLDRVRITTSNGTDTFDAGSVNIMYE